MKKACSPSPADGLNGAPQFVSEKNRRNVNKPDFSELLPEPGCPLLWEELRPGYMPANPFGSHSNFGTSVPG